MYTETGVGEVFIPFEAKSPRMRRMAGATPDLWLPCRDEIHQFVLHIVHNLTEEAFKINDTNCCNKLVATVLTLPLKVTTPTAVINYLRFCLPCMELKNSRHLSKSVIGQVSLLTRTCRVACDMRVNSDLTTSLGCPVVQ